MVLPILTACGVEVINPALLHARCPAEGLHTTPTGPGHCIIFPNAGTPRIFCHHTSCTSHVDAVNRKLWHYSRHAARSAMMAAHVVRQRNTQQGREHQRQKLQQRAARILPLVLEEFHWPVAKIATQSPTRINLSPALHHHLLLGLFDEKDVVWIGDRVNQSGCFWHRTRFRTVSRWQERTLCPGVFICPSTFLPGSCSRSERNVATRKFLVVESDKLGRDEVGAVFRMLQKQFGLHLRAVVDTGNKSLHAWFDMPAPHVSAGLKVVLPAFGCDDAMFRPAQPCRLPGATRPDTKRSQELLYLDLAPAPYGAHPAGTAAP
ncbi:MAG: hypothetical protein INR62_07130 [Rhodospirillales bacterium]|nr:hypothetical protein [Acetobacter sp.]